MFANMVQFKIGCTLGPRCFGPLYHELIYEDLLARPEHVLRELCGELSVAYEPGMLKFAPAAEGLVSDAEMSWKRETLGPLLRDNAGKWKKELTDWEVSITELVCRPAFRAGRYETSGRHTLLTPVRRHAASLFVLLLSALGVVYTVYRNWAIQRVLR